ncbi:AtuA-related protein [Acinetobacter baumannii]|uniref:AtuA-related protein n=1 Tax=Acinetobacter baumannii TaxID=470 RepID=UPI003C6C4DD6
MIKLFSFLIDKNQVNVEIDFDGQCHAVKIPQGVSTEQLLTLTAGENAVYQGDEIEVPLIEIAHARSGDKGNHSNIGVIARKADYLPWIRAALTEQSVASYMQHVLDAEKGRVIRYELPGLNALNFMLENALGGGGVASLRIDPQGKAFAQQLLDMPVKVPAHLLEK